MQPLFIIGNPRSGTTLLRLMIHSHSKFVIPPEAGFALWLFKKYQNFNPNDLGKFLVELKQTKKIENWNLDWQKLEIFIKKRNPVSYSLLIETVYQYYAKSIGKEFSNWGDKNNFYLNYIDDIKLLFPQAFFLHIVRDGRNVACSYRELSRKKFSSPDAPNFAFDISEIANEWNNNINKIKCSFEKFNFENVIEIRLEDLVSEPQLTLAPILEKYGSKFESSMLDYYKIEVEQGREPTSYMEWKSKNLKPIMNESSEKFRRILSEHEINLFNNIAENNLRSYQYQM